MFAQVRKEVSSCTVCDCVKASFKVKDPALKPLSIMEMFYRWGVDPCKMPFKSASGDRYVVVMIELSECAVNSAALSYFAVILCTALMQHIASHARQP
jgi:hypothetical protein